MKILAVDDDENICALLREAISAEANHSIVTAPSGPEAIRAIAKAKVPFDCFLLDIQMPVMDGITLAKKIRKIKGHARTPILMLTAMSQKKYVDAAFEAGATDYISKPFDFLELFSRIAIAKRQVEEQTRIEQNAMEMAALKRDLIFSATHSLQEPIEISGVTQMLGYVAFEDALMEMPWTKLMRSSVFAVKITTVESAFTSLSQVAFRQMIADIGSELMSVIADNEAIATYRGNGIYLCRSPKHSKFVSARLEIELNQRLAYVPSTQIDGLQNTVNFGNAISMLSLSRAGALSALQKAQASAEDCAKNSFKTLSQLRKSMRLHPGSGFQNEMERRAYETLLQDALREEAESIRPAAAYG